MNSSAQRKTNVEKRSVKSEKQKKRKSKSATHSAVSLKNQQESRDTFIYDIREGLDKIESKMVGIRDNSSQLAAGLKQKIDKDLTELDAKYSEFKGRLKKLKTSSQDNWRDDKVAVRKRVHELAANLKELFNGSEQKVVRRPKAL